MTMSRLFCILVLVLTCSNYAVRVTAQSNPTTITISSVSLTSVTLTWTTTSCSRSSCYEAEYRIENDDHTYGTWSVAPRVTSSGSTYTLKINGLRIASLYHVSVRAISASSKSNWVSISFRTTGLIRRPIHALSNTEKQAYISALYALNPKGTTGAFISQAGTNYKNFVIQHAMVQVPVPDGSGGTNIFDRAHGGPGFLPWHRQFLSVFERELKKSLPTSTYGSQFGIAYWQWAADDANNIPYPNLGIFPWTSDFFGSQLNSSTGLMLDGAFRVSSWTKVLVEEADNPTRGVISADGLMQSCGTRPLPPVMAGRDAIDSFFQDFATRPIDQQTFLTFTSWLENIHNQVHFWVSNDMVPLTSPNHPAFFMHHAFIDKLWYEFQVRYPSVAYNPLGWSVPDGSRGHNYSSSLQLKSQMIYVNQYDSSGNLDMVATNALPVNQKTIQDVMDVSAMGTRYVDTWNETWSTPLKLSGTLVSAPTLTWVTNKASGVTVTSSSTTFSSGRILYNVPYQYTAWTTLTLKLTTISMSTTGSSFSISLWNSTDSLSVVAGVYSTCSTCTKVQTLTFVIPSSHRALGQTIIISVTTSGAPVTVSQVTLTAVSNPPSTSTTVTTSSRIERAASAEIPLLPGFVMRRSQQLPQKPQ